MFAKSIKTLHECLQEGELLRHLKPRHYVQNV